MPDILFFVFWTIIVFGFLYLVFPRQFKNTVYAIVPKWRREFVVVHFIKHATQSPLKYHIIPDKKTRFGSIEGGEYDLSDDNAMPNSPIFRKRLNFLVQEGNSIPVKTTLTEITDTQKLFVFKNKLFVNRVVELSSESAIKECPECHKKVVLNNAPIITWAFRVKSALTTQAYDFIYGEKRQWAFIIAIVFGVITFIGLLYAISEIQQIKPLVETIYQRTIVGNETLIIRQK